MAMTLITTNTSSGAANSAFTSSIDSTYKLFIFKWYDVGPATDDVTLQFNVSDDTSSHSYDITKTTAYHRSYHAEADDNAVLSYSTSSDIAQGTGYQGITGGLGNDADASAVGELFLFNPSNTTYVKHFYSRSNSYGNNDASSNTFTSGYFNTTAAITALNFQMSSGNMDAVIKMYGVG